MELKSACLWQREILFSTSDDFQIYGYKRRISQSEQITKYRFLQDSIKHRFFALIERRSNSSCCQYRFYSFDKIICTLTISSMKLKNQFKRSEQKCTEIRVIMLFSNPKSVFYIVSLTADMCTGLDEMFELNYKFVIASSLCFKFS